MITDRKRLLLWLLAVTAVASVAGWGAAHWNANKQRHATEESERLDAQADAEYRRLTEPAIGRAALVSAAELIKNPEKFDGKRVILSGVFRPSFEGTTFDLGDSAQTFAITVSFDWQKIDEPMGDLSGRMERDSPSGMQDVRIVAEGTFHFRIPESREKQPRYIYLSGPGFFVVDRLFQYEPLEKETDRPPQPKLPGQRG